MFSADEFFVFTLSCLATLYFLFRWYRPLVKAWPPERNVQAKNTLAFLPLFFFALLFLTLRFLASFDVVGSFMYILFYIVLGYAWVLVGLSIMSFCFGLIWPDDAVYHNNKAALVVIIGEFFALGAIYAGANIGDGPGWWCVVFAGALGLAAWLVLGLVYHLFTGVFDRVTIDRDFGSAWRFCLYLFLSGVILGRACSGDWTSFSKTVEEFLSGWLL
jgi:hypothetical protein